MWNGIKYSPFEALVDKLISEGISEEMLVQWLHDSKSKIIPQNIKMTVHNKYRDRKQIQK